MTQDRPPAALSACPRDEPHKAERAFFRSFYSVLMQAAEKAAGSPRDLDAEMADHRNDRVFFPPKERKTPLFSNRPEKTSTSTGRSFQEPETEMTGTGQRGPSRGIFLFPAPLENLPPQDCINALDPGLNMFCEDTPVQNNQYEQSVRTKVRQEGAFSK